MKLTLIVVEAPEHSNMSNHTKVFEKNGTIGRSEKSTWVLPDTKRVLSSNHIQISVDENQCTVTDTSTNGSSLNEPNNLLGKQKPHPLQNGDIIIIGEYKLKAVLDAPNNSTAPPPTAGSVLDNYDKTTFATSESANRSQLEKSAENLDQFIDSPSSPSSFKSGNDQGGWARDFGTSDASLGDTPNVDPLASQQSHSPQSNFGFDSDQSASFGNPSSLGLNNPKNSFDQQTPQWNEKEDWWKDGSSSDQSPIINERIDTFKPEQEPAFVNQGNPSADQFDHLFDNSPTTTPPDTEISETHNLNRWGATPQPQQNHNSGLGIDEHAPGFVPSVEPTQDQQTFGFTPDQQISSVVPSSQPDTVSGHGTNSAATPEIPPEQHWFGAQTNQPQESQKAFTDDGFPASHSNQQPRPQQAPQNFGGAESTPRPSSREDQTPYNVSPNAPHQAPNVNATRGNSEPSHPQWNTTPPPENLRANSNQPHVPQNGAKQLAELLTLEWSNVTRPDDLLSDSAEMITETIRRLMDLLRARSAVKNELRVERTMIETVNNNPLKFTTDTSDALNIIFEKQGRSYMSPKETIEDSFDDLSDHQIAVLAGMQSAYDTMFRYFHPENLEKRFKNKSNLFSNKNAMNWESFVSHYEELISEKEQTYARIFGEHFAVAYEKQLSELKSARSFTNNNRNT